MAPSVDDPVEAVADPPSDVELLARYLKGGDMDAFAAIVDRHQAALLRLAHAILRDGALAEDAVQDGLLRLCREAAALLASAGERRDLGGWLCAVVRNRCLDHLRRPAPSVLPEDAAGPRGADAVPADQLWQAVSSLPPLERAAVTLRYRDQLDYRTVAERLGKSVSHVGVILHTALGRLRQHAALRAEAAP